MSYFVVTDDNGQRWAFQTDGPLCGIVAAARTTLHWDSPKDDIKRDIDTNEFAEADAKHARLIAVFGDRN